VRLGDWIVWVLLSCAALLSVWWWRGVVVDVSRPERLSLANLQLDGRGLLLVIVLSPNCGSCNSDSERYVHLLDEYSGRYTTRAVLLPQSTKLADLKFNDPAWLNATKGVLVRQIQFERLGITSAPAVFLVDDGGRILERQTGPLSYHEFHALIERGNSIRVDREWNESSLKAGEASKLLRTDKLAVVDTRDRDEFSTQHIVGARNIPADELGARWRFELSSMQGILFYCGTAEIPLIVNSGCRIAALNALHSPAKTYFLSEPPDSLSAAGIPVTDGTR